MFIQVKEYIVEERPFKLKVDKCATGNVLLQLMRRDLQVLFFPFPNKVTQLICADTGKKIKKAHWSPEIKAAALGMKSNHSVPMWGYYSFAVLALIVLIGVPVCFMNELKEKERYDNSFMGQTMAKRKQLLQSLSLGDLIATRTQVYQIESVKPENIIIVESENVPDDNIYIALTNEAYPETSFTEEKRSIPASTFVNGMLSSTELIVNVLDN